MNLKSYLMALTSCIVLFGCTEAMDTSSPEDKDASDVIPSEPELPAVIPGEAIVLFSDEMMELIEDDLQNGSVITKSSGLNRLAQELGVSTMTRVFPHAGRFEARTRAEGLHKWYKVTYDPDVPATKASDDLSSMDGIEIVEPVRRVRNTAIFDDPRMGEQWHYVNDGSKDGFSAGSDINVAPVWENYTTGIPSVIVAVVDGGIDQNHEDLAANYVAGYNFVSGTSKVVPHDHGTHVAGTVAAVNNNGIGVCGVAGGDYKNGNRGVGLLSCQIFEPNPDDPAKDLSADGAPAIKWGADNGAVISQNSWGLIYETAEEQEAAEIPQHIKGAIDYFIKYAGMDENGRQVGPMAGGVVIFAAGNDSRAHDPIGKYDPVISVGSIGPDFKRTTYSNYGDWVDLAAPGGEAPGMIMSTLPANRYGTMKGTSMACPHVSGVAALIVSHFAGEGFTNTILREKLIKGANSSVMSKNAKIGALLDAFGSMTYGGKIAPKPVSSAEAVAESNNVFMTFDVTADEDDNKAYGYLVLAAKDKALLNDVNFKSLPEGVVSSTTLVGSVKVGERITAGLRGLEFEESYFVAVAAYDYRGNHSALSPVYQVTTQSNNAPVVTTDYAGDYKVKSHETLNITYLISDPDGHAFTVDFKPGSDALSFEKIALGKYSVTIKGNIVDPGVYKAEISVSDVYGGAGVFAFDYEILENRAPVIIKDVENMMFQTVGQKFSLDMNDYLSDPDGETLTYSIAISDRTVLHLNPIDNVLNATVLGYGLTEVAIVAKDSRGLSCTLRFKVLVKDASDPLSMYPNPVLDWLTVSTLDESETRIVIVSSTGMTMYDETLPVSAFEPAKIDMTSYAPGQYRVTVNYNGDEYKRTIVKL